MAAAAHGDLHLAVDRDLDGRGLGRQASHGDPGRLDVEAEPEPEQPPLVERLGLELAEAVVVDHVSCLLERLVDRYGVVDQAGRGGVREIARLHHVAAAELERVDAEPAGDGVHHLLAPDGLHHPRAAVRAPAASVRVDRLARVDNARDPVWPGQDHPDESDAAAPGRRERPGVLEMLGPHREDARVVVDGDAHRHAILARVQARHEVLAAILDPLDGPADQLAGQHSVELLGDHEHLLPEAATDVLHDHPHAVLRQIARPGEEAAGAVRALRRQPDDELLAVPVPVGDDTTRLHRHAQIAVLRERLGDDVSRVREDPLELGVLDGGHQVSHVGAELRMDERRALGQRLLHVKHGRERVDVDDDELAGVLGDVP